MSETPRNPQRKPAAFTVETGPDARAPGEPKNRAPASFDENIVMTADADDPFFETTRSLPPPPEAAPRRRRFSFGKIIVAALGVLVSLAVGLWIDTLVRDLFTRADWLGYLAITAAAIALIACVVLIIRECLGIMRLNAVQALKTQAIEASVAPCLLYTSPSPRD